MKALILFSGFNGQTYAIASCIASILKEEQQDSDVINILNANSIDYNQYDRILIGASVRYGNFHPSVINFIKQNFIRIQKLSSGFFSVNLTARKSDKCTPQTNHYTRKFLSCSPWHPDCCAVFAGALRYPQYCFIDKIIIKFIMYVTGGETNLKKEVEYTDWDQVIYFARMFRRLRLKN